MIGCPAENYLHENFCLSVIFLEMTSALKIQHNFISDVKVTPSLLFFFIFLLTPRDTELADYMWLIAVSVNPK